MWILYNTNRPETRVALVPGKSYKVGRVGGHLPDLKLDTSIRYTTTVSLLFNVTKPWRQQHHTLVEVSFFKSYFSRNHAEIKCQPATGNDRRPRVIVSDPKSTYGTYVGEAAIASSGSNSSQTDRLRAGKDVVMTHGTRVRFGLHSTIFK